MKTHVSFVGLVLVLSISIGCEKRAIEAQPEPVCAINFKCGEGKVQVEICEVSETCHKTTACGTDYYCEDIQPVPVLPSAPKQ